MRAICLSFRALVYTCVSHIDSFFVHFFSADQSKQRREVVRRKTAEYLKHAEELYQKHLAEEQEEVCVCVLFVNFNDTC